MNPRDIKITEKKVMTVIISAYGWTFECFLGRIAEPLVSVGTALVFQY